MALDEIREHQSAGESVKKDDFVEKGTATKEQGVQFALPFFGNLCADDVIGGELRMSTTETGGDPDLCRREVFFPVLNAKRMELVWRDDEADAP